MSVHPSFSKDLNIDSLLLYLNLAYFPTPQTIWKTAKKLPPGHWILIKNNKIQVEKYWELKPKNTWAIDQNTFTEKVEQCFRESIEFRSRSDVPVGTFLSGGIDSSAITALFVNNPQSLFIPFVWTSLVKKIMRATMLVW